MRWPTRERWLEGLSTMIAGILAIGVYAIIAVTALSTYTGARRVYRWATGKRVY